MRDNRGQDESFILPGATTQGKFNCAVCGSFDLGLAFDANNMVIRVFCKTCENFLDVHLQVPAQPGPRIEVPR